MTSNVPMVSAEITEAAKTLMELVALDAATHAPLKHANYVSPSKASAELSTTKAGSSETNAWPAINKTWPAVYKAGDKSRSASPSASGRKGSASSDRKSMKQRKSSGPIPASPSIGDAAVPRKARGTSAPSSHGVCKTTGEKVPWTDDQRRFLFWLKASGETHDECRAALAARFEGVQRTSQACRLVLMKTKDDHWDLWEAAEKAKTPFDVDTDPIPELTPAALAALAVPQVPLAPASPAESEATLVYDHEISSFALPAPAVELEAISRRVSDQGRIIATPTSSVVFTSPVMHHLTCPVMAEPASSVVSRSSPQATTAARESVQMSAACQATLNDITLFTSRARLDIERVSAGIFLRTSPASGSTKHKSMASAPRDFSLCAL